MTERTQTDDIYAAAGDLQSICQARLLESAGNNDMRAMDNAMTMVRDAGTRSLRNEAGSSAGTDELEQLWGATLVGMFAMSGFLGLDAGRMIAKQLETQCASQTN